MAARETMRERGKSNLAGVIGAIVVAVVLALLGAMLLTRAAPRKDVPLKSPVQVRADEIKGLEQLLQEDIADARKEGKTEAEIVEMKAKYGAEINRLKAEIETLKAGGQLEIP